jgi:hypothetical protein
LPTLAVGGTVATMSTAPGTTLSTVKRRLTLYVCISALVAILAMFLGENVAPCLALTPGTCVEAWESQKNLLQRLYDGFGLWPFGIGTFVVLVLATFAVDRLRGRR